MRGVETGPAFGAIFDANSHQMVQTRFGAGREVVLRFILFLRLNGPVYKFGAYEPDFGSKVVSRRYPGIKILLL